ncbi:unnamed protein product [Prunus brigantina]
MITYSIYGTDQWHLQIHQHSGLTGLKTIQLLQKPLLGATCWLLDCALLWKKNERELLNSHGFTQNQLTLWKYPSMAKVAELTGHTSRVLYMAQSPDGCTCSSISSW